jgi:hypothetical protein
MSFVPISIDKYVKIHLKSNPNENEKDLRIRLKDALIAFKKVKNAIVETTSG